MNRKERRAARGVAPRYDYQVYTLTGGGRLVLDRVRWANGTCEPLHPSKEDAMEAVARDPDFGGWDKVLHLSDQS